MAVTMRDVASAAGVSVATVSFVVNGSKRVAPHTRNRIERAIEELGYHPNRVARALASQRNGIVAIVYPTSGRQVLSGLPYITAASTAAREAGQHLVVWPVAHDGAELRDLVGQQLVDGVVLMEVLIDDARVAILDEMGFPFALIGRSGDTTGRHCVDIDFDRTVELALNHLEDLGHTRFALVGGSQPGASLATYGPFVRIEAAFRSAAVSRGFDPAVVEAPPSVQGGREAAAQLVRDWPETTAVLVANEATAAGVTDELARLGRAVPGSISVLSLNSSREMADRCSPPLTIVTTPGEDLGRLGFEALQRRLSGVPAGEPVLRYGELSLGRSTAPPPRARPATPLARRGDLPGIEPTRARRAPKKLRRSPNQRP